MPMIFYSDVYYFYFEDGAQDALGEQPAGSSYLPFSPTYSSSTLSSDPAFISLMKAIGAAIGNAAAHDTGHHLEQLTNIRSNNFQGFPHMDCGLALNPRVNPNRPGPRRTGGSVAWAWLRHRST